MQIGGTTADSHRLGVSSSPRRCSGHCCAQFEDYRDGLCGCVAQNCRQAMVMGHAWDLVGARSIDLGAAFVARREPPDHVVADLSEEVARHPARLSEPH